MRNWELIIIDRFFGKKKKKNGREIFTDSEDHAARQAKRIYKEKLSFFQRLIYTYRFY